MGFDIWQCDYESCRYPSPRTTECSVEVLCSSLNKQLMDLYPTSRIVDITGTINNPETINISLTKTSLVELSRSPAP
jgi:hypothetical protein